MKMRASLLRPASLIFLATLLCRAVVFADSTPTLTTLTKPDLTVTQAGSNPFNAVVYMPFSTGSTTTQLDSVVVELDSTSPSIQTFTVGLYLAPLGVPGGAALFTDFVFSGTSGIEFTFDTVTTFQLQPNTTYAFSLQGSGSVSWTITDSVSGYDTTDGWQMLPVYQSVFGGSVDPVGPFFASGAIFATAIPEPSSFATISGGLIFSLVILRRRSVRRSAA
jgi:hypothetical protein